MDLEPFLEVVRASGTVPGRQAAFRQLRGPGSNGLRQAAIVVGVAAVPPVVALVLVSSWGWSEALVALAGLLVGSMVVYFGHRFPMHRRMRGVAIAYDMHTRVHHMLFDEDHVEIREVDDVDMVMLPWRHALALCGLVVPLLAAPWLLLSLDAALVFGGVISAYYLTYELVHLASHLRVGGPLDRVPGLGWLLRHHRRHHAWPLMHHGNFSMLIPLWDYLLGTKLPANGD